MVARRRRLPLVLKGVFRRGLRIVGRLFTRRLQLHALIKRFNVVRGIMFRFVIQGTILVTRLARVVGGRVVYCAKGPNLGLSVLCVAALLGNRRDLRRDFLGGVVNSVFVVCNRRGV